MQTINIIKETNNQTPPPIIDDWNPNEEDIIFRNVKRYFIAPVSMFWRIQPDNILDMFDLATKKCYNSQEMRDHMCLYLNYFEKYYDQDKEYLTILCRLKFLIMNGDGYNKNSFIHDIRRYILSQSIVGKVMALVEYNYTLSLNYKSILHYSIQMNMLRCL